MHNTSMYTLYIFLAGLKANSANTTSLKVMVMIRILPYLSMGLCWDHTTIIIWSIQPAKPLYIIYWDFINDIR